MAAVSAVDKKRSWASGRQKAGKPVNERRPHPRFEMRPMRSETMCFRYRMRRAIICQDVPFQKRRPRTWTVPPLATVTRLSVDATLVTWTTV